MTRQLQYQKGYVSNPIKTNKGIVFKIRYRIPSANGSFRHRCETLYGLTGKKAARAVLEDRIRSISTETNHQASEMSLQDFIDAFWKPSLERANLKPSTWNGYKSVLDCHVLPELGNLCISDIAPLHIEEFVQKKTAKGLAPKTVRNLLMVLRGIFTVAVEQDVILRSPVRKAHMPIVKKKQKHIWSPEQVRKIIENSPDSHKVLFTLVSLTGLRLGELLAIQWQHADFESELLMITQSLWHGQIVSTKTEGSVRSIPLGPVLCEILKSHFQASQYQNADDFVFCKKDGSPFHPDVVRKDLLYPILDRLGIKRIPRESGFHAFRHSAGSIVQNETGNIKLVQSLLGHSNLSTTSDIYTHTFTEAEREASESLERAIFKDLFPVVPNSGTGNRNSIN